MLRYSIFTVTAILWVVLASACGGVPSRVIIIGDTPTPMKVQSVPETTADAARTPTRKLSPTLTRTALPTKAPTNTATPTEIPDTEVVIRDDFSLPCALGKWVDAKFSRGCEAGKYVMVFKAENWAADAVYPGTDLGDVIVEVDGMSLDGKDDGLYGIVVRYGRDPYAFYAFGVHPNGEYAMAKYSKAAGWEQQSVQPNVAAIKKGKETNRLKMIAQGDQIAVFVNDEWLNTFPAPELKSGGVGLEAWGSNSSVAFSNLVVTKINKPQKLPAPRQAPGKGSQGATTRIPQSKQPAATSTTEPTQQAVDANPCQLKGGDAGIIFENTRNFQVKLTIGGGEWGTHDYWFEGHTTTPIQFPPGAYTATLDIPGEGHWMFADDRITFDAGSCTSFKTP